MVIAFDLLFRQWVIDNSRSKLSSAKKVWRKKEDEISHSYLLDFYLDNFPN
jgi:hypothetical protein